MGKKLFKSLIKKASRPVSKDAGILDHPDSYNEKQTRSNKVADTSGKPHGKSRSKNVSTGSKNPR